MRTANGQFWPKADDDKLMSAWAGRAMIGEAGWKIIAEGLSMPRTWQACRQRVQYLHRKATGVLPKKRDPKERKVNGRIYRRDVMQEPLSADALPQHQTLTAWFFKDPLPGRSALDRRAPADTPTPNLRSDLPRRNALDQMRAGLT